MKKMNKKGFTIVELVVVIAVIAILAAVMIPTFGGIVEKANASKALQQARNAYTQYLVAHPTADIEIVEVDGVKYDVKDEFKVVDTDSTKKLVVGKCALSCDGTVCAECEGAGTASHEYDATTFKCECGAVNPAHTEHSYVDGKCACGAEQV